MRLAELAAALELEELIPGAAGEREVTGGFVSDLLSDVMGRASSGDLWVTSQTHQNVVAVALLVGVAAVVMVGGVRPAEDTLARAREEGIPLYCTRLPAFEVVGRAYALGIRGSQRP